jgi:hypothetical protein
VFSDSIAGKLELTIGLNPLATTIPAGDITRFDVRLHPWGLEGEAEFWIVSPGSTEDDGLFSSFMGQDPIKVALTIKRSFDESDATASSVTLKGIVTEKSVDERAVEDVTNAPVLQRKYTIRFMDRAQVLWRQHFPVALYVDKSYQALITDNLPSGLTITHSWSRSSATHPVLALGLGAGGKASFYDFLMWLLSKEHAALFYSAADDTYSIKDEKPSDALGIALDAERVGDLVVRFPATRRDKVRVMNAYSEAATRTKDVANEKAVTGVRSDHLIRSAVSSDLDTRATLETSRTKLRAHEITAAFSSFPTSPPVPGKKITLGEGWSTALYPSGKTYRATEVRIAAKAEKQEAGANLGEEASRFEIDYELGCELATDLVLPYPAFVAPRWPFHVEGKVLSETGAATDTTYQAYTDQTTSLDRYKVKVPLFSDIKVIVSYEPVTLTGHFYFPAYRDARVLLALHFDVARIVGFLDWKPGARLPLDTQGNHLLIGKGDKNQTSISHVYEDAKPALKIARASQADRQTITISEGTILIETRDVEG